MLSKLFRTDGGWSLFILRLFLAIVIFPHGAQKIFGWFGGYGFAGTMANFTDRMHIPWIFALLAILAESLGSWALIVGFLTRIAAFGILCNMIVAILLVHTPNGFFMNWGGKQKGEGFEYHLLAMGMCLALVIAGGGKWSADRAIAKHLGGDP
jgi:putative oxidoreductase